MEGFINSSPELISKLKMLDKKFKTITIAPTYFTTPNLTLILPAFTNLSGTLPIKEIYTLIESGRFTFTRDTVTYSITPSFTIRKTIAMEEPLKPVATGGHTAKTPLSIEVTAGFIDKMRNFEFVDVCTEGSEMKWHWHGVESATVRFPCKEVVRGFRMRVKDLWFMGCVYEKIVMGTGEGGVCFYLYENNIVMIVRVDMVS